MSQHVQFQQRASTWHSGGKSRSWERFGLQPACICGRALWWCHLSVLYPLQNKNKTSQSEDTSFKLFIICIVLYKKITLRPHQPNLQTQLSLNKSWTMAKARLPVVVITIAITGNTTGKHHSKEQTSRGPVWKEWLHTKLPSRSSLKGAACKLVSPGGHIKDCSPNSLSLPPPSFPVNCGGFHAFDRGRCWRHTLWSSPSDEEVPPLWTTSRHRLHTAPLSDVGLGGWFARLISMVACWLCFAVVWKFAHSLDWVICYCFCCLWYCSADWKSSVKDLESERNIQTPYTL